MLHTGIAFHTAIADQPRPAFLDLRDDPWSIGDRVAWDELPVQACPVALDLLEPLINARRPVDLASQVVHGDLPGNVLFRTCRMDARPGRGIIPTRDRPRRHLRQTRAELS